jgi:mannose-6-phosphate isomerase-like protein (cupin superfamily)
MRAILKISLGIIIVAVCLSVLVLAQQPSSQVLVWAPKPIKPNGWIAPNRPITKLSDLLAKHKGQGDWTETVVSDEYLHADYISMAPGKKTQPAFNPDTREWWVIQDGQIRFTIEGQTPFVAVKGYLVQVPYRNAFSMETVGDKPSLRFEVNIANVRTKIYPITETPPSVPGMEFLKVTMAGKGAYANGNRPFIDFFKEMATGANAHRRFITDDRAASDIITGIGGPDPNPAGKGAFHEECSEFWFILQGQMRFTIETLPTFIAGQGDIVYAPKQMWHAPSFAGTGPAARLAMNAYPDLGHSEEPIDK